MADDFGNLRDWDGVPERMRQLANSGKLLEQEDGLIRILRYRV